MFFTAFYCGKGGVYTFLGKKKKQNNKFQSKCSNLEGEVEVVGSFSVTNRARMSR